jgi:hypothetical protein
MINYTEKGAGLYEAISAVGHSLVQHDGEWVASDEAAVQAIIDGYTLDRTKAEKCASVSLHAKALRDKVVTSISPGEMASWPIKRSEAEKYLATADETQCHMLSAEATKRGISVAALVAKVEGNSARFSAAETAIGGNDGKHRDAIAALLDFGAVAAYDYSTGWPEV